MFQLKVLTLVKCVSGVGVDTGDVFQVWLLTVTVVKCVSGVCVLTMVTCVSGVYVLTQVMCLRCGC